MSKDSGQSLLKALLQGTAILTLSNITLKAINFFLLPLYTAYLTPEMLGINDAISNFTSLVYTLLVIAFDSAFSAFYYDKPDEEHRIRVLSTVWFTLFSTSLVAVSLCVLSSQISLLLFSSADYALAIQLSLLGVVLNLLWLPFSLDLRVRNKMGLYSIGTITASVSMILLNVFFVVFLEMGYYSLILSSLIVNLLELVLFSTFCRKTPKPKFFDKQLMASMLKYSLPLMPSAFAYWIIQLASTYIIMGFGTTSDAGVYGVATRCATVVNMVSSAFFMSYTAYAFQKATSDPNAPKSFARILSIFFILFAIICLMGSLLGKEVIGIMAAEEYWAAAAILPGLLFGQMFYGLSQVAGYGLSIVKKPVYISISVFCSAGLSLILNIALIASIGPVGASFASAIAYACLFALVVHFAQKQYPCPFELGKITLCSCAIISISALCFSFALPIRLLAIVVGMALIAFIFRDALRDAGQVAKELLKRN